MKASLQRLTALLCCLGAATVLIAQQRSRAPLKTEAVHVEMKNIVYHFTQPIAVGIPWLQGEVVPTRTSSIPVFDDANSFRFKLVYAEFRVKSDILSAVLNQYVFAAPDAPLKAISILNDGDMLKIKGKLHQKNDVPFETRGKLAPTPDGRIRLEVEKAKAGALPVKGLMDLVGLKVADLINTRKVAGVQSDGNALIFDPEQIFPPPHIEGKVTGLRLEADEIVLVFGVKPQKAISGERGNYMAYRGGALSFGKLTMRDADMVLLDMNPEDAFDFYLDRYKDQLIAGYSKTTSDFGLRVYMRDFNKLGSASAEKQH
ncbi:MAG TPA: hypothetical protein VFA89_09875 [Terriglobales bacterium]|nr:hypothetical protein [Terriglobales bacterium]